MPSPAVSAIDDSSDVVLIINEQNLYDIDSDRVFLQAMLPDIQIRTSFYMMFLPAADRFTGQAVICPASRFYFYETQRPMIQRYDIDFSVPAPEVAFQDYTPHLLQKPYSPLLSFFS